ncbi:MAG: bifunctional UDP-sugar hydrolase/5'-nucleotidase [Bacteroidales bacterium]|nr:bifunctional UDP-sugar hydrolase/5'-nucleotidase [Bacteroidales bacterium]
MRNLKYPAYTFLLIIIMFFTSCEDADKSSHIHIFNLTDVHGAVFDRDPLTGRENYSSMAKFASFLKDYDPREYVLLDNGDNLQGSPAVYYYNFEDTTVRHLWAGILNYLGYDASTAGNHDIEAGHKVYDRIRKEYDFPLLAANAVDEETGEPYFDPYTIIDSKGLRIAVMGLITPGVPGWLPEILYRGIRFDDMVETAARWMPVIEKENPDLVIGLFHAGWDETYEGEKGSYLNNNASIAVAEKVKGFDIIFIGHDHDIINEYIINSSGDSVLILDSGSRARYAAAAKVTYSGKKEKNIISVEGDIINLTDRRPDTDFVENFRDEFTAVSEYVSHEIGSLSETISTREAYFGDSGFMDLIHNVQLKVSGADISFAAPLSYDVKLDKGALTVSDMFSLYRYENMLYTVEMSGEEVDRYLEYSYAKWFSTMKGPEDNLFETENTDRGYSFKNQTYNFDSAEGINYIVDVSKPDGHKVEILSFTDGRVFDKDKIYLVALNSYRGSGGGGHLEYAFLADDAGITNRLVESTDKDLRYYMIRWFDNNGEIVIRTNNNWKLVPENWVNKAGDREYEKLFTSGN